MPIGNLPPINNSQDPAIKSKMLKNQIISALAVVAGLIIGKFFGLVFLIFLLGAVLGQWFPQWYFKRQKVNYKLVKFIAWANVLTWLSIPFGLFTGFATLGFSKLANQDNKKYKILAIVGIGLSIINLLLGIIMSLE